VAVERDLSTRLGLPVRLQPRGKGGTLSIAYRSLEQLDELIRRLT
jgi:ParB family chromosome partitioning protein